MPVNLFTANSIPDLSGRTALITGANSGLGLATARHLAGHGCKVIFACRSLPKAKEAIASLITEGLSKELFSELSLDLADLDQVKQAAERAIVMMGQLDMLILNAGLMATPKSTTKQGHELQFGVNHLGHYALTLHLMPILQKTEGSRVVVIASAGHKQSRGINLADPGNLNGNYHPQRAYFDSKLANLLFARGLQTRLDAAGLRSPMVVMAHPGMTRTNLSQNSWFIRLLENIFRAMPPEKGSLSQVRAAVDSTAQKLDYYGPNGMGELKGDPVKVDMTDYAKDQAAAEALWTYSKEVTGIDLS